MGLKIFLLFLTIFVFSLVDGTDPIVQISNGKVQGQLMQTLENKTFYAFSGIPYAKPPIGDLRFQPPQPANNWEGVLDDRNAHKICIQLMSELNPNETEDCLYLHVYTPQLPSNETKELLPIIYVIHGGGFITGSADFDLFGPHHFIDKNIILVNVQYRLGLLGFLSTEDLVCPGNNGLKDQKFALEWIQKNIRQFGGDPKKVTIFGQSSGGVSIGYHLISPKSKGLFHAAIQHSGSSLNTLSLKTNPKTDAYLIGNKLNSSITEENTTSQELVNFLKTISFEEFRKASVDLFEKLAFDFTHVFETGWVIGAVIEPEHDEAFLNQSIYDLFNSGNFNKVPTLMGFNSEEVLSLISEKNFKERIKRYDSNPELLVPLDMHITDITTLKEVGKKIKNIYVQNETFSNNIGPTIKYLSDTTVCRCMLKQTELQSQHADVYLYVFAYSGKLGYGPLPPPYVPGADSVNHNEDLLYLFYIKLSGDLNNYPKEDILTMNRMITMWTNFIKYLNPTPEPVDLLQNATWPKITSTTNLSYLLINDTLKVEVNPKKKMMDTYKILYDSYAIPPLITY